nr:MAG TPA: hypothetical protein [Caudoviricetes sp.]
MYHLRAANARERKFPGCYFYTLSSFLGDDLHGKT